MPSVSPKQHALMEAANPKSRAKANRKLPPESVAKEFLEADKQVKEKRARKVRRSAALSGIKARLKKRYG